MADEPLQNEPLQSEPAPTDRTMDGRPGPVRESERVDTIDVIRGFVLLGIFIPNIPTFAFPIYPGSDAPAIAMTAANSWAVWGTDVFVRMKFMFMFAMLFGAGAWLMGRKHDGESLAKGAGRWHVRCAWMLAIGVAHGVFVWFGDILVWYSLCGLIALWWVRRLPVWALWSIALVIYSAFAGLAYLLFAMGDSGGGGGPESIPFMTIPGQIAAYTGGYLDTFGHRLPMVFMFWAFFLFFGPMLFGIMLFGMGLAKIGFLTGKLSTPVYAITAAVGVPLGVGLTIALCGTPAADATYRSPDLIFPLGQVFGLPYVLGYASVLILLCRGVFGRIGKAVTRPLAAVGRTALSNYLAHSLIAAFIFYGSFLGLPSLGMYNQIEYPALWLIVLGVWAGNLILSTLWLKAFTMGPAEWVWRCLTDGRLHPIRRTPRPA